MLSHISALISLKSSDSNGSEQIIVAPVIIIQTHKAASDAVPYGARCASQRALDTSELWASDAALRASYTGIWISYRPDAASPVSAAVGVALPLVARGCLF